MQKGIQRGRNGCAVQGLVGRLKKGLKAKGPVVFNNRPFRLIVFFHAVELAKFTQSFSAFPTFTYTWFLVVLTSFEFAFDTINLQFLLQLADRVLKVAFDFDFNHLKSHPLVFE